MIVNDYKYIKYAFSKPSLYVDIRYDCFFTTSLQQLQCWPPQAACRPEVRNCAARRLDWDAFEGDAT